MDKQKSAVVLVKNLVKKYRKVDKNAVDGVSFTIEPGGFFAFLGPNGAGKTTTISILTTTMSKTSGLVKIAGYDIDHEPAMVRQNLGIIFQNPSLDQNLTGEENIRLHAVLYGLYPFRPAFTLMPEGYRMEVEELADVLGIKEQIFRPVKTLSGGMRRKMEIVRSLMHRPKVLFLDEPTSGLDPLSRRSLWEYLNLIRREKKTTIFLTTHYLEEAEKASNVCIINHGKIVASGTPARLKKDLTEEYLLLDAKNREMLKKELARRRLKYAEDGVLRVGLNGESAQQIIASLHTPLNFLRIHAPTLEEAYLEVIGDGQGD